MCKTEINDVFVDEANRMYIAIFMYNLIEHRGNYSGTSGSLYKFKRDSKSFKYKAALVGKTADAADGNGFVKNTKIFISVKYLINFLRLLEMPIINCKFHI